MNIGFLDEICRVYYKIIRLVHVKLKIYSVVFIVGYESSLWALKVKGQGYRGHDDMQISAKIMYKTGNAHVLVIKELSWNFNLK